MKNISPNLRQTNPKIYGPALKFNDQSKKQNHIAKNSILHSILFPSSSKRTYYPFLTAILIFSIIIVDLSLVTSLNISL